MFEPLGKIIDMLRAYGVVIPEESLVQLQELPDKWANTKRLSVMAIQQVLGSEYTRNKNSGHFFMHYDSNGINYSCFFHLF
jgi:hypothetical protein